MSLTDGATGVLSCILKKKMEEAMQRDNQNVIWIFHSGEKKFMEIEPDGNKNIFSNDTIKKSYDFNFFSLYDIINDVFYTIDLNSGDIIINGIPLSINKDIGGRQRMLNGEGFDYRSGLIQYKESFPVTLGKDCEVSPRNFNIGYKIDTSKNNKFVFDCDTYISSIIMVKVIVSIDSTSMKPGISVTLTEKRSFKDGTEQILKV